MKNSYYTYIEENKLLIECFCGETEIEDVISLKKEIDSNLSQVPKFKVLIDVQNSINKPSSGLVEEIVKFLSQSKSTLKMDKIAVLTNTPNQVVNTMLCVDKLERKLNIPIKIFSIIESAINWLNLDIRIEKVKTTLEEFKNKNEFQ